MTKRPKPEFYQPPPPHLEGCAPEQALCYDFIEEAHLRGWRVIPEFPDSTFDLFLVAEESCSTPFAKPGTQIGVQAKMSLNPELLGQVLKATDTKRGKVGPDYVVALVPGRPRTDTELVLEEALRRLGIGLFYVYEYFESHYTHHTKRENLGGLHFFGRPHEFKSRITMPEIECWTEPGVASPSAITKWKIRAVKFCMEVERQGSVTYVEFEKHKMHVATWLNARWMIPSGEKDGRKLKYILNPDSPNRPDRAHPELKKKLEEKDAREKARAAKGKQAP